MYSLQLQCEQVEYSLASQAAVKSTSYVVSSTDDIMVPKICRQVVSWVALSLVGEVALIPLPVGATPAATSYRGDTACLPHFSVLVLLSLCDYLYHTLVFTCRTASVPACQKSRLAKMLLVFPRSAGPHRPGPSWLGQHPRHISQCSPHQA